MLAMVHTAATYRGADETAFKGFAAEEGSEDFWSHPRLHTSVCFEPAPMAYRVPGHSSPPTALGDEYKARKRAAAVQLLAEPAVVAWFEQLRTSPAKALARFEAVGSFRAKLMTIVTAQVGGMPGVLEEARGRVDGTSGPTGPDGTARGARPSPRL